jgi:hypothetical protein
MQTMITRTEISPGKAPFSIEKDSSIITLGSCFADMIGDRMKHYRLNVTSNPFGTCYNPISIFQLLTISIERKYNPLPAELGGVWYDHQFHSELSALSPEELHQLTNEKIAETYTKLKSASILIITFGTAWVYRHVNNNSIVNNCHKQAGKHFKKELISVKHILEEFETLYKELKQLNPSLKIILTVSPVRHIKDTLPLNSVSKANLISASYYICDQFDDCYYFPAYELQVDDLRDYRYYSEDLIHPSSLAQEYIWNKLTNWAFSPLLHDIMKEWDHLHRLLQHKAFHPTSVAHQEFLIQAINRFNQFDYWDVSQEINILKAQLI